MLVWLIVCAVLPVLPASSFVVTFRAGHGGCQDQFLCCFSMRGSSSSLNVFMGGSGPSNGKEDPREAERGNDVLLGEFKTNGGEVLEPYDVLKVSRDADAATIKKSYRNLSKRYHPDGVRHRVILPGKCNNLEDVREEWERVKLSYEILSDRQRRARYDRNSALADPKAAAGRATLNFLGWGIAGVGKGVWKMGEMAVNQIANKDDERCQEEQV